MKCNDCNGRLRVRQSYSGNNWRVQRLVCEDCRSVYCAETALKKADGYGKGAFARSKKLEYQDRHPSPDWIVP